MTFKVEADGEGLTYQWQLSDDDGRNWRNSSNKTATYSTTLSTVNNGRSVRCVVTDASGKSVASDAAKMTVQAAADTLKITAQPTDSTGQIGDLVTFKVEADGESLTYQWQLSDDDGRNWRNSANKTAIYSTTLSTVNNGRSVRCVVTDASGKSVASDAAKMIVGSQVLELAIVGQPSDCEEELGELVRFEVYAEGEGLTYQWQLSDDDGLNWRNSANKTPAYSTTLSEKNNGRCVRCIVTDATGASVISDPARMLVRSQTVELAIVGQPTDCIALPDELVRFEVYAEGEGLTYQWQLSDDGGQTWRNSSNKTAVYSTTLSERNNGRCVRCIVTDATGASVISDPARMAVITELRIIEQPMDAEGRMDEELSFWVEAEGEDLSCVWEYSDDGGENWQSYGVEGPDLSEYVNENTDGRMVRCVITDVYGNSVVSDPARMILRYELVIVSQPEDMTVYEGDELVLPVYAEGSDVVYQWQYSDDDGQTWTNIDNTDEWFVKTAEEADNGRLYRCVVSDRMGNEEISDSARIVVRRLPRIVSQSQSCEGYPEDRFELFVEAEGDQLTYFWQYSEDGENWYDVWNAETQEYETAWVCPVTVFPYNERGLLYRCVVTDEAGHEVMSDEITVSMIPTPLTITVQPEDAEFEPYEEVVFRVEADGFDLNYQWQESTDGGQSWLDVWNSTPELPVAQGAYGDNYLYRCVVTDFWGNEVVSDVATLRLIPNPLTITYQPDSYVGDLGDEVTFTVKATGYDVTYYWERYDPYDDEWWGVCDGNTLTVVLDTDTDGNRYRCVLHGTNYTEELISDEVTVSLVANPLTITRQPESYEGNPGDVVTLTVEATGYNVRYDWQYSEDGENWNWLWYEDQHCYAESETATVTLNLNNHNWKYRCLVKDVRNNEIVSDEVTVSLIPDPLTIVTQPENFEGRPGENADFYIAAKGYDVNYRWEWYSPSDEEWYEVGEGASLSISTLNVNNYHWLYRCVVTDYWGNQVISDEVTATLAPNPLTITRQPENYVGNPGDDVDFYVEATGYEVTYAWEQYDSDNDEWIYIGGGDHLSVSTLQPWNSGTRYRNVVTDFEGNQIISDEVTMTLIPNPPTITRQPQGYVGEPGDDVTLRVEATGYDVEYMWQWYSEDDRQWNGYSEGNVIHLTLDTVTHGMRFRCVATDYEGNQVISDEVTVRFEMEPVTITAQPQSYEGNPDDTVVLSVGAEGYDLSYEWQCRANDNDGWQSVWNDETEQYETGASMWLTLTTDRHLWQYRCLVRGIDDITVDSDIATVSLVPKPLTIVNQPQDFTGVPGDEVSLAVDAEGYGLTYRWQYRDNNSYWYDLWNEEREEYETDATVRFAMSTAVNNRQFRCFVRDFQDNEVKTNTVTVKLADNPLTVTLQPENCRGVPGDTATFTAEAAGYDVSYRWQYNDGDGWNDCWNDEQWDYENGTTLTVTLDTGNYQRRYRCVMTDYKGTRVSTNAVTFSLVPNPVSFVTQPQNREGEPGDGFTFTAEATGYDVTYRWEQYSAGWDRWSDICYNDVWYDGQNLYVNLTLENHDGVYRCVATDFEGNEVYSEEVTATLVPNPVTFVTQPRSYEGEPGDQVNLTAEATGYGVTYRWEQYRPGWNDWIDVWYDSVWYDGQNLYVNLSAGNHDGVYRCVATDFEGNEVYSEKVSVTLVPNPLTIVTQPQSYAGEPGDEVTLRVEATGYGLTYRWQVSNDDWNYWIDEENYGNTLSLTLNAGINGNRYRWVITDFEGNEVISDEAVITLIQN